MDFIEDFFFVPYVEYKHSQELIDWYIQVSNGEEEYCQNSSHINYCSLKQTLYQLYNLIPHDSYISSMNKIIDKFPQYIDHKNLEETSSELELVHVDDIDTLKRNLMYLLTTSNIEPLKNNYPFEHPDNFLYRNHLMLDFFSHIVFSKEGCILSYNNESEYIQHIENIVCILKKHLEKDEFLNIWCNKFDLLLDDIIHGTILCILLKVRQFIVLYFNIYIKKYRILETVEKYIVCFFNNNICDKIYILNYEFFKRDIDMIMKKETLSCEDYIFDIDNRNHKRIYSICDTILCLFKKNDNDKIYEIFSKNMDLVLKLTKDYRGSIILFNIIFDFFKYYIKKDCLWQMFYRIKLLSYNKIMKYFSKQDKKYLFYTQLFINNLYYPQYECICCFEKFQYLDILLFCKNCTSSIVHLTCAIQFNIDSNMMKCMTCCCFGELFYVYDYLEMI